MKLFTVTRPKVGIALGGGAALGLAHIGVLKLLQEEAIPIDVVAGTSIGAIIGACFSKDGEISKVEEVTLKTGWRDIARLLDPRLRALSKGLIRGQRIEDLLQSLIGNIKFKDMKIPFAAVSTDVNTGQEVVITSGSVIEAVRASISLPGIFVPVMLNNRCLVDGGLTSPVPTKVPRSMGAKFIIAVNVISDPQKGKRAALTKASTRVESPNIFRTLLQSMLIMEYEILKQGIMNADAIINPFVSFIEPYEFHRGDEAIQAGYRAAKDALPRLKKLLGKRLKQPDTFGISPSR